MQGKRSRKILTRSEKPVDSSSGSNEEFASGESIENVKSEGGELESPTVYKDEDGNLCIGGECLKLKLNSKSNTLEVDLTECSDEVRGEIAKAVITGSPTVYSVHKQKQGKMEELEDEQ